MGADTMSIEELKRILSYVDQLKPIERRCLVAIGQNAGVMYQDLVKMCGASPGATSNAVASLVRRGLINSWGNRSDRRVTHYSMTPDGYRELIRDASARTGRNVGEVGGVKWHVQTVGTPGADVERRPV